MLLALAVVQIGVLGLFAPQELILKAPPGAALRLRVDSTEFVLAPGKTASLIRRGNRIEGMGREGSIVHVASRDGRDAEFALAIKGKIERTFRGRLTVSVAAGALTPVVAMERESAVAAVVAAEYPASTQPEAMKAMAVLARSYYSAPPRRHKGFDRDFDFCDTTHCQFHRESPARSHPAWAAVDATRHEVLQFQGETFGPLYFGSCDGSTRTASDIGMSGRGYPYFRVSCRHSIRRWKSAKDSRLDGTESSRLRVNRERGEWALKSNSYTLNGNVVEGRGEGHLAGLCQHGAAERKGTYREILAHYYPNTSLAIDEP